MNTSQFQKIVWRYYQKNRRSLPWRKTHDPYKILVSEVMLQQTQVDRVIPKYKEFLKKFPSFRALAQAPTSNVIREWQGLGYNRRALNLQRCAREVVQKYGGKLPSNYTTLVKLSGIGPYTAGALMAFVWNKPMVCIETNIRAVFIHHFFSVGKKVTDKELLPLIETTLDTQNPREWYWALMDYGSHLKKTLPNPSRKSAHHTTQQKFKGSNRELRGAILKILSKNRATEKNILKVTKRKPIEVRTQLKQLTREGFIKKQGTTFSLK